MAKDLALILAGPPPKKGLPASPSSEPDMDDAGGPSAEEVSAFKEMQAAIKGGDAHTGAMALKNFLKECGAY
jgi:hypothetical protein